MYAASSRESWRPFSRLKLCPAIVDEAAGTLWAAGDETLRLPLEGMEADLSTLGSRLSDATLPMGLQSSLEKEAPMTMERALIQAVCTGATVRRKGVLVTPIILQAKIAAVVSVFGRKAFSDGEVDFLRDIAGQIGPCLSRCGTIGRERQQLSVTESELDDLRLENASASQQWTDMKAELALERRLVRSISVIARFPRRAIDDTSDASDAKRLARIVQRLRSCDCPRNQRTVVKGMDGGQIALRAALHYESREGRNDDLVMAEIAVMAQSASSARRIAQPLQSAADFAPRFIPADESRSRRAYDRDVVPLSESTVCFREHGSLLPLKERNNFQWSRIRYSQRSMLESPILFCPSLMRRTTSLHCFIYAEQIFPR